MNMLWSSTVLAALLGAAIACPNAPRTKRGIPIVAKEMIYLGEGARNEKLPDGGDGTGGTVDMDTDVLRSADLNCQGGSCSCWANEFRDDLLQWEKTYEPPGGVAPLAYTYHYAWSGVQRSEMPRGDWLSAMSNQTMPAFDAATLISCPVPCANGDVSITYAQWLTQKVNLRVCLYDYATGGLEDCQPTSSPSPPDVPGPVTTTFRSSAQTKKRFRLALIADNFVDSRLGRDGGAAMVQDIRVDYANCPVTTTTTTTTTTTPRPLVTEDPAVVAAREAEARRLEQERLARLEREAIAKECSAFACSFGSSWCGWGNEGSAALSARNGLQSTEMIRMPNGGRLGNWATGVQGGPNSFDDPYLGAKLEHYTQAGITSDYPEGLSADRTFKFKWYMAIDRGHYVYCCDNSCDRLQDNTAAQGTYGEWSFADEHSSFSCPSGTRKISIACVNDASYVGACGLGHLQMYRAPAGGSAGDATRATEELC